MIPYALVGIGGAIGAMLRYGVSSVGGQFWPSPFPYATVLINVAGSLAMGLLVGILARVLPQGQNEIRLFVAVGILGGFTTFSAFSLDTVTLWQRGDVTGTGIYVVFSVVLSIAALFLGLWVARIGA